MSSRVSAVDFILNQGNKFDPHTVPGFTERTKESDEFRGFDNVAIREKLLQEAESEDYHADEAEGMELEDRLNGTRDNE